MKKNTFFSLFVLVSFIVLNINLFSQQSEIRVTDITFESANSLTFDVYLKNNGTSNFIYSHGSFAWNYDPAFINGGTPTFSLVPGYSDFPTNAQPPSALISNSNILRTSSNMPGSNGIILPGQSLRLQRFRLQTSAASFNGSYFNLTWKNSVVPYTRIYSWDSGTGLPSEITELQFILAQPLLVENFEFTGNLTDNGWTAHSGGGTQPINTTTGLVYTDYPGSGVGNAALLDNTGEDVNKTFTEQTAGYVYCSFLVNVTNTVAGYYIHLGTGTSSFAARVFTRPSSTPDKINFGISNSSTAVYGNTDFDSGTTYLAIIKYEVGTTSDVSIWIVPSGIPYSEAAAGTPEVTATGTTGLASITGIYLRQYNSAQNITLDGIRITTAWEDLFSAPTGPSLSVLPANLSNFSYLVGSGGPSVSQSYDLSGTDLTPASGNITVTGSTNYEVSTDNSNFSSGINVAYTAGTLATTTIYVRLKAGLQAGFYNSEIITNEGGGATTTNVNCNGVVLKPEPSDHVTSFAGVLGIPDYYLVNLSWVDVSGANVPDGYIIKGSDIDYASIIDPVDGSIEVNSYLVQNVEQGLQTSAFGLNSGTTYYFKIYPYTNSGSAIDYKTDGSVPQFSLSTNTAPLLPITENFNYPTGSSLTSNGWVAHSGAGTNPILVNDTPLSYPGYLNSGIGKSVSMTTTGEDDNRAFGNITNNSVYASFMVNISSAQLPGDYIFNFAPENSSFFYYGRMFVKKNTGDSLAFGIAKNVSASVIYTPFDYSLNTTYLIVVKYTFNPGTTTDDEVKLWINPVLDGTEPIADVTQTDTGTDALSLGMFALRQGSSSNAPNLILGGIRVADTWVPGSGATTFPLTVDVNDGWNMVSVPGIHPVDQNVTTWWSGKDPSAGVFRFSSGYLPVTETTPGEGYWMKHVGSNTYNTGDEWSAGGIQIVPNVPIAGATGWNLIGGYELSVLTANITTTPAGLQTGQVFGYSGGYTPATNLVPGYGYWIKLTGAGSINIPTSLAKGLAKTTEVNISDWGKIIITDNTGISYTLYTVKGEVNLDDYELPPAPPEGMFDVRFGSGRYAEELSAVNQTIELNSLEYPVRVRVENADIRLQDGTGSGLNERLKAGEEVTISNSSINKLMVLGDVIPATYSLDQNYPNPFNPSTKIEFSIPEDVNNVTLTIYNALGQRVAELVNSKMEAGKYSYVWNARDVATGLYIYELRTDKFVSVKKMMLLK